MWDQSEKISSFFFMIAPPDSAKVPSEVTSSFTLNAISDILNAIIRVDPESILNPSGKSIFSTDFSLDLSVAPKFSENNAILSSSAENSAQVARSVISIPSPPVKLKLSNKKRPASPGDPNSSYKKPRIGFVSFHDNS